MQGEEEISIGRPLILVVDDDITLASAICAVLEEQGYLAIAAADGYIASAVIAMSRSLGLHVIAERVETEGQQRFLQRQGSHLLQGFLFGRPMPSHELEAYLKRHQNASGTTEPSLSVIAINPTTAVD